MKISIHEPRDLGIIPVHMHDPMSIGVAFGRYVDVQSDA
jgi:hypothetical protein